MILSLGGFRLSELMFDEFCAAMKSDPRTAVRLERELRRLASISYAWYLASPYWDIVRREVLHRCDYVCAECLSDHHVQVHHLHYDHLGREWRHLDCLVALCDRCHSRQHDKLVRVDALTRALRLEDGLAIEAEARRAGIDTTRSYA